MCLLLLCAIFILVFFYSAACSTHTTMFRGSNAKYKAGYFPRQVNITPEMSRFHPYVSLSITPTIISSKEYEFRMTLDQPVVFQALLAYSNSYPTKTIHILVATSSATLPLTVHHSPPYPRVGLK